MKCNAAESGVPIRAAGDCALPAFIRRIHVLNDSKPCI
jgi:hypothetical protein